MGGKKNHTNKLTPTNRLVLNDRRVQEQDREASMRETREEVTENLTVRSEVKKGEYKEVPGEEKKA